MSIFEASRTLWTSRMLSVFRIVAGLMLFSAGTMRVAGFPLGVAGTLEMIGGVALVLGIMTRPVAFVLAVEMAVVSPFPTLHNGQLTVLYCFFFLYLTFAGAGAWSIDALLVRSKMLRRMRELQRAPQMEAEARRKLHTGPMLVR